jgi:hypothetical protein
MLGELILKVQGEDVRRKEIREMAKKVVDDGKAKILQIDAGRSSSSPSTNGSAPRMNGHAPTQQLGAGEQTFR